MRMNFEYILKGLEKNLKAASMKENPKKYFEKSTAYSALAGIAAWFILGVATSRIIESLLFGAIISLFSFCIFLYYPISKKRNIAKYFEKELPFALSAMAVELNIKIPFEKCIENISKGNYGVVSKEFGKVSDEIKKSGSSFNEALLHLAERIDSLMLRRAISQIVAAYVQGNKDTNAGEPLKKISSEILSRQKAESKEFSGKLVVFSLLFIAVSAIVPAIFQAFIIVGSMFLKLSFNALQIFLIVTVGFPLLDIGILIYIRSKTPVFLRD